MMKVLITGVAGTGKTTVATELKKRGHFSFDVDTETNIPFSMNIHTGKKEIIPRPRPQGWRLNHRWIWNKEALKDFFNENVSEVIFLCGGADNLTDCYHFFDKLFVLTASPETLLERIQSRTHTEYGKQKNERDEALMVQEQVIKGIQAQGGMVINTEQPIDSVINLIIQNVHDN